MRTYTPRPGMPGYKIRYWRDKEWTERWLKAGFYKPEGYVTSSAPPTDEQTARELAAHINSFHPTFPCLVVKAG